jgi:hypothetical protein
MAGGDAGELVGRSYTRARRYPWVIGNFPTLGGERPVRIPGGPYSMPQVVVFVVVVLALSRTWRVWAHHGFASLLFAVVVALVPAWAVRRARVEGRPLHRAAAGLVSFLAAPRNGRVDGRRGYREPSPVRLTAAVRMRPGPPTELPASSGPRPCSGLDVLRARAVAAGRGGGSG